MPRQPVDSPSLFQGEQIATAKTGGVRGDDHIQQRFAATFRFAGRLHFATLFEPLPFRVALHVKPSAEIPEVLRGIECC